MNFFSVLFFLCPLLLSAKDPFAGNWALEMDNGQAGWLHLAHENGQWHGELKTVGQPKKISTIERKNNTLTFIRNCRTGKPDYPGGPPTGKPSPCLVTASVKNNLITLIRQNPDASTTTHSGKLLPPLPKKPDLNKVKFGPPLSLFNGRNLDGWKLTNPAQKNGWKVVDGTLVNETPKKSFDAFSPFGNLRTERTFGDGRLRLEFNVPEGGNSGVYVRGAYEAQVVDRDSRMQGIQGVGAIFGRIAPTKNAGKPGGQWQSYEITIIDRHATVVLNGETVIANQPIIGNTNGAVLADTTSPGPLMLQGDHTSVRYRNITFEPNVTPRKILFVGNSYTGGIRGMVSQLIQSSPYSESTVTFVNPGGKNLAFHLASKKTVELIQNGNFDFVILQDQSQTPAALPQRFHDAAKGLDRIIDQSGAQTVFYQTWGRRDGDKQNARLFPTFEKMQEALTKNYRLAAGNCLATLAPVGEAWARLRETHPDLGRELYRKDGSHPSEKGAYLAACVFYGVLFDEDPRSLATPKNIPADEAKIIRRTAFQQLTMAPQD
ncbi:MAG: family 16 glycoside hydrolase [Akkermansiaceae bacterium]